MTLETLITPGEFLDYLEYRQALLGRFKSASRMSEKSLLGRYLWLPVSEAVTNYELTKNFSERVDRLVPKKSQFDISYILRNFREHIESASGLKEKTDYYYILVEFAKLRRYELGVAKQRIQACLKAIETDSFRAPYRFISAHTHCGFLFVPIHSSQLSSRIDVLVALTDLSKYEQRLERYVGVAFAKSEPGVIDIRWVLIERPWVSDSKLEKLLKEHNPFRRLRGKVTFPYSFREPG